MCLAAWLFNAKVFAHKKADALHRLFVCGMGRR
jgi:hypothetical protein